MRPSTVFAGIMAIFTKEKKFVILIINIVSEVRALILCIANMFIELKL